MYIMHIAHRRGPVNPVFSFSRINLEISVLRISVALGPCDNICLGAFNSIGLVNVHTHTHKRM